MYEYRITNKCTNIEYHKCRMKYLAPHLEYGTRTEGVIAQGRRQVTGLAGVAAGQEGAHVVAVRYAKVLREPVPGGQGVPEAEVPLADGGGGVAGGPQQLRQGRLVQGEAETAARLQHGGVHTAPYRVAACH
jgi:hypothetical protein